MTHEEVETIKWKLTELSCAEPEQIECNDYEIYGEDEHGQSGICTVQITKVAEEALALIHHLNAALENARKKMYIAAGHLPS